MRDGRQAKPGGHQESSNRGRHAVLGVIYT
jgi:hypothetical protein